MADGMKIHFDQCIVWRLGFLGKAKGQEANCYSG